MGLAAVGGGRPALAEADLENGEAVFGGNCAACHAGGNNSVVPEKKLRRRRLSSTSPAATTSKPSRPRSPTARAPCLPLASALAPMTSRTWPITSSTRQTNGECAQFFRFFSVLACTY